MAFQKVATRDELKERRPVPAQVGGAIIALVLDGDQLYAIDDACSHGSYPLSAGRYDPQTCSLECVGHGSRFDLRTGQPMEPPASWPNQIFPTRLDGDDVLVDLENPLT